MTARSRLSTRAPGGGGTALFALPVERGRRGSCYNDLEAAGIDGATRIGRESPPKERAATPLRPAH